MTVKLYRTKLETLANLTLNSSETALSLNLDDRDREIIRLIYQGLFSQAIGSTEIAERLGLSRQAAHARLAELVRKGLLAKAGSAYCLGGAGAAEIIFPGSSIEDRVKRLILAHALEVRTNPWVDAGRKSMGERRPDAYFDVKNIIHPAFSADAELRITAWSDELPRIFGREPERNEKFTTYLRSFPNMLPWDLTGNHVITKQHFVDSLVLPELSSTPEGEPPNIRYKLVRFRRPFQEDRFLFFSFVAQRIYPGIQCIANDASEQIRDVWRLNDELEKVYGLRPDIRQPLNVIASAQVSLETLARRLEASSISRHLKDARNLLQNGDQSGTDARAEKALENAIKEAEEEVYKWRLKLFEVASSLTKVKGRFSEIADNLPMPLDSADQEVVLSEVLEREVKKLRERMQKDLEMSNVQLTVLASGTDDFARARINGVSYILSEAVRALLRNAYNACKDAVDSPVKRIEITTSCPAKSVVEIRIVNTGAMEQDRVEYFNERGRSEIPVKANDFGRVSGCILALKTAKRANGSLKFETHADRNETIVSFRAKITSSLPPHGPEENQAT